MKPGDNVTIHGLNGAAELNGKTGLLLAFNDRGPNAGRWTVRIVDENRVVAVKPCNLQSTVIDYDECGSSSTSDIVGHDRGLEYSARSYTFENGTTMKLMAEQIIAAGAILEADGRPFTIETYNAMSAKEKKGTLVSFFMQEWDTKSSEERMWEISRMPPHCGTCNQERDNMTPDASLGFTRLICSDCAMRGLMGMR